MIKEEYWKIINRHLKDDPREQVIEPRIPIYPKFDYESMFDGYRTFVLAKSYVIEGEVARVWSFSESYQGEITKMDLTLLIERGLAEKMRSGLSSYHRSIDRMSNPDRLTDVMGRIKKELLR